MRKNTCDHLHRLVVDLPLVLDLVYIEMVVLVVVLDYSVLVTMERIQDIDDQL